MTTYRTGNHQPRNLYRGDEYIGACFDPADTALIVRALNEGCTRVGLHNCRGEWRNHDHEQTPPTLDDARIIGEALAARDEDAPGSPLSSTETAQTGPARGSGCTDGPDALSGRCRKCGSGLEACTNCGETALCGEPWCATCQPDGGWHGQPERKADQA